MDDFVVVNEGDEYLVVRTTDWVVVARCSSSTFGNLVANALN